MDGEARNRDHRIPTAVEVTSVLGSASPSPMHQFILQRVFSTRSAPGVSFCSHGWCDTYSPLPRFSLCWCRNLWSLIRSSVVLGSAADSKQYQSIDERRVSAAECINRCRLRRGLS